MDQIKELEKYKELLDSGAISEEEFAQLKQKLLGLKTDEEKEAERQAERDQALKEIDAMREAQKQKEENTKPQQPNEQANAGAVRQEQAESETVQPKPENSSGADAVPPVEPVKSEEVRQEPEETAHPEAGQQAQGTKAEEKPAEESAKVQPASEQPQQTQSSGRSAGSVIKSIVLWAVCILLLLLAIPSLMISNAFYIIFGIIALLLAVLACPLITSRTQNIPALATFYMVKIPVVVALVILAFVFMLLAGSSGV